MKKLLLILFLGLGFNQYSGYAQITSGGLEAPGSNPTKSTGNSESPDVFKNRFYITFGLIKPVGLWSRAQTFSNSGPALQGHDGFAAGNGFSFNLGTMIYLRNIQIHDNVKVGIDWTIANLDVVKAANNAVFVFAGTKLGGFASYQLFDQLLIDGGISISPALSVYVDDYSEKINFGFRPTLSGRVRYNSLLLGMDYDFGTFKGDAESDPSLYSDTPSLSYHIKPKFIRLRFGLVF